ncbi:hypothetical protein JN535_14630 [Cellulosimicrobium cellulans]|uniref:hypothetical protein n=1 Tax=Cellulosimicrobium cellulans TaxID=1710 RepID=UPI001966893D|nr:hypothetical protein [Cellulosimicrobium cellulans]MBN0041398.1 hypothetical protein [Cellulosimicrobium cellulans]
MYVPPSIPRYRPTTTPPLATPSSAAARPPAATATAVVGPGAAHPAQPAVASPPPLTLEWLVARDIDAYTARRRAKTRR